MLSVLSKLEMQYPEDAQSVPALKLMPRLRVAATSMCSQTVKTRNSGQSKVQVQVYVEVQVKATAWAAVGLVRDAGAGHMQFHW